VIVILLLIPLSIGFATAFLLAFIWAVRSGQYEDTCTPSMRVLLEETESGASRPGARPGETRAPGLEHGQDAIRTNTIKHSP
jgi:cbb3-type cytochrome oxidase maturation protein